MSCLWVWLKAMGAHRRPLSHRMGSRDGGLVQSPAHWDGQSSLQGLEGVLCPEIPLNPHVPLMTAPSLALTAPLLPPYGV